MTLGLDPKRWRMTSRFSPGLGAEHLAPAVEEELRVIADPGTNLQHALVAEVEPQRGQVLLTAGVVPKVKML